MTDALQGLELSIVITGQGNAVPVVDKTRDAVDRLKKTGTETGEALALSQRRAAIFALQGLEPIAQLGPQVTGALANMAGRAAVLDSALSLLEPVAIGLGAAFAALSLSDIIGEFALLGESLDRYNERQKKTIELERDFIDLTARRGQFFRDSQRAIIENAAAVEAAQLRSGDQELRALEVERRSKLELLELDRREREAKLSALILEGADEVQVKRERLAVEEEFAAKRLRINADVDAALRKFSDDRFARDDAAEAAFTKASAARRSAEIQARIATAQDEGRGIEAARLQTAQVVLQTQADLAARELELRTQVRAKQLSQVEADQLRGQAALEANAKIQSALQQEIIVRRQVRDAAIAAIGNIFGPTQDRGALAANAETARQAVVDARAQVAAAGTLGGAVGSPTNLIVGAGSLAGDLERVQQLDDAYERLTQAVAAYNQALADQEKAAQRPQLSEGLKDINDLNTQLTTLAQDLANAERSGVPVNFVLDEQAKITAGLPEKWQALLDKYRDTPAVIDILNRSFGSLATAEGFAARVRDALAGIGSTDQLVTTSLNNFEGHLQGIPNLAQAANQGIDGMIGRLRTVSIEALNAAGAIERLNRTMQQPAGRSHVTVFAPEETES